MITLDSITSSLIKRVYDGIVCIRISFRMASSNLLAVKGRGKKKSEIFNDFNIFIYFSERGNGGNTIHYRHH
ncbi:hypothetical protein BVX99_02475 [bacterium F16]|nr:hypothetical protein BVX99_02475 [bacterium F16]